MAKTTSSEPARLFAERFLTEVREATSGTTPIYNEELGYSITSDHRPYVESAREGETRTASEVQAERDDSDEDVRTRTTTFVQAEADDWEGARFVGRTETAIRGEQPDYDSWAATSTMTKVQNESEDRD